jgi:hypothetical protein
MISIFNGYKLVLKKIVKKKRIKEKNYEISLANSSKMESACA